MWRVEDNMFIIPSVSREMLDMKVECGVTNTEGRGADSVVITVACEYHCQYLDYLNVNCLIFDLPMFTNFFKCHPPKTNNISSDW